MTVPRLPEKLDFPCTVRPLAAGEGGGYLVALPDLPGWIFDGETVDEALANGTDAKQAWLAVAREQGRPMPEPDGQLSGKWVQRVPRSVHARPV